MWAPNSFKTDCPWLFSDSNTPRQRYATPPRALPCRAKCEGEQNVMDSERIFAPGQRRSRKTRCMHASYIGCITLISKRDSASIKRMSHFCHLASCCHVPLDRVSKVELLVASETGEGQCSSVSPPNSAAAAQRCTALGMGLQDQTTPY
jgi:hypothetical protein